MMKNTNYIIISCVVLVMLVSTSCTSWLDQEPMSNATDKSYFQNVAEFTAAANNLYSELQGYNTTMNYTIFDNGTDLNYLGRDELSGNTSVPVSDTYYSSPYKYLRAANNLLAAAADFTGTDNIDTSVGTAYFFRAWWHFYLLQRYGGITLALVVPQTTSDFVWGARNSRYEVISSILSDLKNAQTLLKSTTKTSTANSGAIDIEAVSAFLARVCLYEGTWEKYNGRGSDDATNGDGVTSGAGTAMPVGYPSVTELLTMAQTESAKFVSGGIYAGEYSVWMKCEDHPIAAYDQTSSYYLFGLEDIDSNPYGVAKSSNDEAILRKCFDYSLQAYGGTNLTHSEPCGGTRKLMDMYLCTDGLPVHKSPLFQGYHGLNSEFANRDARMCCLFKQIGHYYWSANNEHGKVADYTKAPSDDATNLSGIYAPILTTYSGGTYNGNNGYVGRKYTEERQRPTTQESADLMLIRLPEMLLTYAESTYELDGKISDADLNNTVNVIRKRAHIADLTNALVNNNGLDMKQEIRRERTLELYGEGFRLNDLCRWGTAAVEMGRPICTYYAAYDGVATELATEEKPGYPGTKMYNATVWASHMVTTETAQDSYTAGMPTVKPGALITEPQSERNFSLKNYLQAIPTNQITLNGNLRQNPQW
jgi:hypothetical protein